ncbi:hypothetical protein OKW49_007113 [Paraburkholderia youngii]|uniref:hypothetical protein n=1 Tax=Paraburkholderia youngii TaxID=2782701 RepID=UPI003D1F47F8
MKQRESAAACSRKMPSNAVSSSMNSLTALSRAASARIADRQDEAAPQFSGDIKNAGCERRISEKRPEKWPFRDANARR